MLLVRERIWGQKGGDESAARVWAVDSVEERALEVGLEGCDGARGMGEGRGQVLDELKDRDGGIGIGRRAFADEVGTDGGLMF